MTALIQVIRRFVADNSGIALVYVTLTLPVLIGFSLLAIDFARVNNLHNDLQKAADAFALEAAAELDGTADSQIRAERALANLVDNTSRFSEASLVGSYHLTSQDISWRFLRSLPASDDTVIPVGDTTYVTTIPTEMQFIEVNVDPQSFTTIFPASMFGAGSNNLTLHATAVAGFGSAVCNFTPVFICNPYEDPSQTGGITLGDAVAQTQYRRREISLRSVGQGAAYFPGNFGFLDSGGANGARALAESIASSSPRACFSRRGVNTKTGQNSGPVKGAINIRFGIREPGANWQGTEYGPAANVRKGVVPKNGTACPTGNQIDYPGDPAASGVMGLPTDDCFKTNSCTLMGGKMGNGNWDFATYWSVNHPGRAIPAEFSGPELPTRYQVYRYEIDNNMVADVSNGGEAGTPKSGCGTPVTSVDRRLLYGAILNCQALSATSNLGGNSTNLPVTAFASFFITEPVKSIPQSEYNADIFVELVDVTGRHGAGTLENFQHDEAQLYR